MTDVSAPPTHTPGPSVGEWEYDDGTGQVDVADGTICVGITWRPNGHLIAAAPDLLAALKFCRNVIDANLAMELSEKIGIEKADAAIAKAEGR